MILLDIGLPKLNGHDACRRIREKPWSRGMVIVALDTGMRPPRALRIGEIHCRAV